MSPKPERALRREIIRLALLDPDDLGALLDEMAPRHRARIEQLLQELAAADAPAGTPAPFAPWLEDRIAARVPMTERSREALRGCVARVRSERREAAHTPSLLERAFVTGAGRAR